MTPLEQQILKTLRGFEALTARQISVGVNAPVSTVQESLIRMDDDGSVIMKNGFYRLPERERAKQWATE